MSQKLPIGIQSFEKLRADGFLYVDKTAYVYELVHAGAPVFLSRPRRFGKSLFLSTLRAYWEGKRELFENLAIERLEEGNRSAWQPHPVFYFDFNSHEYSNSALDQILDDMLKKWELVYGTGVSTTLGGRFDDLLQAAHAQTGHRCVVLVDEYDKPLLENMSNQNRLDHNRTVFKGFFSTLKKCDEHLKFVFITGVTKFGKVSIFSDLNQLQDISLSEKYSDICGINEAELQSYFVEWIDCFANKNKMSPRNCRGQLRAYYDGYRFNPNGPDVYNPFSLFNAFSSGSFGSYWFESGTPTLLIQRLQSARFDLAQLTNDRLWASEAQISNYRTEDPNPVPLLYQTGYLTIRDYDSERRRYTLGIPNEEVKYGLLECLAPAYVPAAAEGTGTDVFALDDALETGNLEAICSILTALFASIPYSQGNDPFEHYFQAVIYIVFTLLGRFAQCEMHTASGRIDCVVATDLYIYLFEFKRDGTTEMALDQIDSRGYARPFAADSRQLYKIGVVFDSSTRQLSGWEVRE